MPATGKFARELETLMMDRLRLDPACSDVTGVVVTARGNDGGWGVVATARNGATLTSDAERAKMSAAQELRRDFFLKKFDYLPLSSTPALIRNGHGLNAGNWGGYGFGTTQEWQNVIRVVFLSHLDIGAGGD
jgi:hypothetical protein